MQKAAVFLDLLRESPFAQRARF